MTGHPCIISNLILCIKYFLFTGTKYATIIAALKRRGEYAMKPKTAIITGASKGIGRALALQFATKGYDLAICGHRDKAALAETSEAITCMGRNCVSCMGDIGNPEFVQDFFQQIQTNYSTIDVLINNAGISHIGLLQDMSDAEWNQIIQTNLSSVFYCCRKAIPLMLAQKHGHIINISSVWGNIGASTEVAYSASKGGVNAFTKALAKELAPSNITVNAIACGYINTDMNKHLSPAEQEALYEEIPMGRPGTPGEAATLAYSLTDTSTYLTGQIITMDGGWT